MTRWRRAIRGIRAGSPSGMTDHAMTRRMRRPYFSGFAGELVEQLLLLLLQLCGGHGAEEQAGVVELLLLDQDVGGLEADGLLLQAGRDAVLERAPDLERLVPLGSARS